MDKPKETFWIPMERAIRQKRHERDETLMSCHENTSKGSISWLNSNSFKIKECKNIKDKTKNKNTKLKDESIE